MGAYACCCRNKVSDLNVLSQVLDLESFVRNKMAQIYALVFVVDYPFKVCMYSYCKYIHTIHMHTHMHTYIHTYTYIHIHTHICTHADGNFMVIFYVL